MIPTSNRRRILLVLMTSLFVLASVDTASGRSRKTPRVATKRQSPQYQQAKVLFIAGIALFDRGHYIQAIAKFKAALTLVRRPKIFLRLALCYKWLGKTVTAIEHYRAFLKKFPKHPQKPKDQVLRKQVTMEIGNLLRLVAQVRIIMPKPAGATIRINGKLVGKAPISRSLLYSPETISVIASARGYYLFRKQLRLEANKRVTIKITLIKTKSKVVKKVIRIGPTPIYKRWWFWTVVGLAVTGGATGFGLYMGLKTTPREMTGIPLNHDSLGREW